MYTKQITIQEEERPHLVLQLQSSAEKPKILTLENKVDDYVSELMASPLFVMQQEFLASWQTELQPSFAAVETKEQKNAAAQYLALLYIEVLTPAKMNKLNALKQRDIDIHKKALELLLKPLLPPGTNPSVFLIKAQLADKQTEELIGCIAIATHAAALKTGELHAHEGALQQDLLVHHASMQSEYFSLSSAMFAQAEVQREQLLTIHQDVQTAHNDISTSVTKAKEIAEQLAAADETLKQVTSLAHRVINNRITR